MYIRNRDSYSLSLVCGKFISCKEILYLTDVKRTMHIVKSIVPGASTKIIFSWKNLIVILEVTRTES